MSTSPRRTGASPTLILADAAHRPAPLHNHEVITSLAPFPSVPHNLPLLPLGGAEVMPHYLHLVGSSLCTDLAMSVGPAAVPGQPRPPGVEASLARGC